MVDGLVPRSRSNCNIEYSLVGARLAIADGALDKVPRRDASC